MHYDRNNTHRWLCKVHLCKLASEVGVTVPAAQIKVLHDDEGAPAAHRGPGVEGPHMEDLWHADGVRVCVMVWTMSGETAARTKHGLETGSFASKHGGVAPTGRFDEEARAVFRGDRGGG